MVKRETPSPRKMFGSASCQHLVVLQWYGKPVGMLCIIYIKSITLGGGISYGALLMWNLVNFHLGWFTKKGTHKSPQKSVFSAFYERFWDLWGPFLGDQPKWKINSGTSCMSLQVTVLHILHTYHDLETGHCASKPAAPVSSSPASPMSTIPAETWIASVELYNAFNGYTDIMKFQLGLLGPIKFAI